MGSAMALIMGIGTLVGALILYVILVYRDKDAHDDK